MVRIRCLVPPGSGSAVNAKSSSKAQVARWINVLLAVWAATTAWGSEFPIGPANADAAPPPAILAQNAPADENKGDGDQPADAQGQPAADLVPEAPAAAGRDNNEGPQTAVVVGLNGPIDELASFSLRRRIELAKERNPDLLIVRIDSPGGLLLESEHLAVLLRDIDWARTVAFISNRALSGAAMTAMGCDDIVMTPHARLGDVGVMAFDPMAEAFRFAPQKLASDVVITMRSLAEAKGRPPALAEAMVDRNIEVFRVRNRDTGEEALMTEKDLAAADPQGERWEKLNLIVESQADRFLDVTGTRAAELGLAEPPVNNFEELLQRYQVTEPPEVIEQSWIDSLVFYLNKPVVTGLLFVIGLVALYMELQMPGIGAGAVISGLCFGLYFWSHWMGGTAGWLEIVLFVAGVVFVLLEIFVIPGFGITGFAGALLIVAALIMAGQRVTIPKTQYDLISLRNTVLSLVVAGAAVVGFAIVTRKRLAGGRSMFQKLILAPPEADPEQPTAPPEQSAEPASQPAREAGPEALVGSIGTTATALRPTGKVRVGGRNIDAVAADSQFIERGRRVRLEAFQTNRYVVREEEPA